MPALHAIALIFALAAPAAEVTAEALDVFDAPGGAAIRTGRVRRGDRVVVRGEMGDWLAIDPPPGSFSWIDGAAIEEAGKGRARVVAARAAVRPGSVGARLPGPPQCVLAAGEAVWLLDRRPLTLRQGGRVRTWRAIEPPLAEVRYVRADGVDRPGPPAPAASARLRRAALATVVPEADPDAVPPPAVAGPLAAIEARHHQALRAPIDGWQLGPIRDDYRALLDGQTDPSARAAVQARLDQIARQSLLAKDARAFLALVERSRKRDAEVAAARARLVAPATAGPLPYDARGLLQPSSKQVDGQKVYALIGPDGATSAYLDLPPGLDAGRMVGHRVGVRGTAHFDEGLNARLFDVRDLDLVDD